MKYLTFGGIEKPGGRGQSFGAGWLPFPGYVNSCSCFLVYFLFLKQRSILSSLLKFLNFPILCEGDWFYIPLNFKMQYLLYSLVFALSLFLANYIDFRKIGMGFVRGETCRKGLRASGWPMFTQCVFYTGLGSSLSPLFSQSHPTRQEQLPNTISYFQLKTPSEFQPKVFQSVESQEKVPAASKVVALDLDLHLISLGTSLHLHNIHCVSGLQIVLLCSQLLGLDI